jgi:hypothetical protein
MAPQGIATGALVKSRGIQAADRGGSTPGTLKALSPVSVGQRRHTGGEVDDQPADSGES